MAYFGNKPSDQAIKIGENTILSSMIDDGVIVNADINASASIATSKVSGALTSVGSHGLATSATTDTTNASNIASGTLNKARLPADSDTITSVGTLGSLNVTGSQSGDFLAKLTSSNAYGLYVKTVGTTTSHDLLKLNDNTGTVFKVMATGETTISGNVRISNGQKYGLNGTDEDWYIGKHTSHHIDINGGGSSGSGRSFRILNHNNANAEMFKVDFHTGNSTFAGEVYIRKDTAIHQASGDTNFTVKTSSGGDPSVILDSEATNRSGFLHFKDQGSQAGYIKYTHNGDSMNFHTGNSGNPTLALIGDNARFVGLVEKATTGNFKLGAGEDADDPPYCFYADSNTGMYRIANGKVGICGVGVTVASFDGNNGFWGGKTVTSPARDLHIARQSGDVAMRVGYYSGSNYCDYSYDYINFDTSSHWDIKAGGHNIVEVHSNGKFRINDLTTAGGALQTDQNGYIEHTSSDERLKTKTKDISDGLSLISQLKPKYFTWKDDEDIDSEISTQSIARRDGEQIGLYAQEVASAIPQASKGGDKDKLWQNYDDRAVMAVMIKSIQELSAEVEKLKGNA